MKRYIALILMAAGIFFIDRAIKELFLNGLFIDTSCITFGYVLNKGVAFSMFAFLGKSLKWILLTLVAVVLVYLYREGLLRRHPLIFGVLLGAALGNLYDRFIYGGVIDYVYWHCGFDFAVFNFADVMIDLAVVILLYFHFKEKGRVAQG